MNVVNWYHLPY